MTNEIIETAKATQEVAKATVKGLEVGEQVCGFFAKIIGEPMDIASGMLSDKLEFRRWKTLLRFMDEVKAINKKRGLEGKEIPVPPKFAIPIIENASLEENDELQDLWVKLMSTAQGAESSRTVRSAFIDIIKQLEVIDIKFLYNMFDLYEKIAGSENIHKQSQRTAISFPKSLTQGMLKLSENTYEEIVDNLLRVRFVVSEIKVNNSVEMGGIPANINMGYNSLCLTSLGVRFVIACVKE